MRLVYAVPPAPEVPHLERNWVGMECQWQGWDGSLWDLTDPDGGVVLLQDGVEGLHMPVFQSWTLKSPALAGQRFTGAVSEPRSVFWPILLYSDDSTEQWQRLDQAFWRTLHPEKPGTWRVQTLTGAGRELTLRYDGSKSHTYPLDPLLSGWAAYGVPLVADQPFWRGDAITSSWSAPKETSFFGDGAPDFTIGEGFSFATAKMSNPGDVPAWPVWTFLGPFIHVAAGVGDRLLEVTLSVPDGKALRIDTDPTDQTLWYGDWDAATGSLVGASDITPSLGRADFAPIPEGEQSPVSINAAGGGSIHCQIRPQYFRAW